MQPHIDLTPMVDLGFLLITFFMLTTSMSRFKAMEIQMPFRPAPEGITAFYESSAVTLIPADNHIVYYYEGLWKEEVQFQKIDLRHADLLRNRLLAKQRSVMNRTRPAERELQVLIKPAPRATVDDVIQVIDEMQILDVKQFALVDLSSAEQVKMSALQK